MKNKYILIPIFLFMPILIDFIMSRLSKNFTLKDAFEDITKMSPVIVNN